MNVPNGFDVRGQALRAGELAAWLAEHSLGNRFGLAVVGSGAAYDSVAVALAIVAADGDGRFIDVAALTPDDEAALVSWLADPGPPKAVHDLKSTMHALAGRGWTLRGVTSDTLLGAHLLRPEQRRSGLNDLLVRHMRCALPAEAVDCQWVSSDAGDETAMQALILRTCAVLDLADVLDEELARIDASSLLGRVELPLVRVLAAMETAGVAVDRAALSGVGNDLPNFIAADGRIHATLRQTGSAAGDIWSSNPSLHEPDNRKLRAALVAGDGYTELLSAGYRRLEPQLLGHLSGDADAGHRAHECRRGIVDEARRAGYASTLLGRRRYLPDLDSANPRLRQAAERAALDWAVQGSAADIIKLAMINVDEMIRALGLKSRLVLTIGAELIFEVCGGEHDALTDCVRQQMCSAYELEAPLEVWFGPAH